MAIESKNRRKAAVGANNSPFVVTFPTGRTCFRIQLFVKHFNAVGEKTLQSSETHTIDFSMHADLREETLGKRTFLFRLAAGRRLPSLRPPAPLAFQNQDPTQGSQFLHFQASCLFLGLDPGKGKRYLSVVTGSRQAISPKVEFQHSQAHAPCPHIWPGELVGLFGGICKEMRHAKRLQKHLFAFYWNDGVTDMICHFFLACVKQGIDSQHITEP